MGIHLGAKYSSFGYFESQIQIFFPEKIFSLSKKILYHSKKILSLKKYFLSLEKHFISLKKHFLSLKKTLFLTKKKGFIATPRLQLGKISLSQCQWTSINGGLKLLIGFWI